MLKFLRGVCLAVCVMFGGVAHAAQMVNVEYIHTLIARDWNIDIAYAEKLKTPKYAANMKYLLTVVDIANQKLNGEATSNYGNGEYATLYAADTVAANDAIRRLIQAKPRFFITTTPNTAEFKFSISAGGTFVVDWGDGEKQRIIRRDTNAKTYSHEYAAPGKYTISIGGRATAYQNTGAAAISFRENKNIAGISGSLGAIFKTIGNPVSQDYGGQPRFTYTFRECTNLTGDIPPELFQGIHGLPSRNMFYETFQNCSGLNGKIPAGLFGKLTGAPSDNGFFETFRDCKNLSGPIPAGLFGNLAGAPRSNMFARTFWGCSKLTGEIPENLFGDISGNPASGMFQNTFVGCAGLGGPSAKINGVPLYDIWPDATRSHVGGCYDGATGLTDYSEIPDVWK